MPEGKLSDKLQSLKGVGPKRGALYQKLGVETVHDLLTFYPKSYLDLSVQIPIMEAPLGENAVIRALVTRKGQEQKIRSGLSLFKATVNDGTQNITVTFFNSKYLFDKLLLNEEYIFYGKVIGTLRRKEMNSPLFVEINETSLIQPIYSLTEGLTNKMVQGNMKEALEVWGDRLTDTLSQEIKQKYKLSQLRYALENIHFPTDQAALALARRRLIFEELFVFQLGLLSLQKRQRKETGISLTHTDLSRFYEALPFTLTGGQLNAINESIADMRGTVPMNRLVQGDVGSGKTMVAAALCMVCSQNGYQSAVMAPTQILADQHYETFSRILEPLGVRCALLTGSQSPSHRQKQLEEIAKGECSVIIGTHALVQEDVVFEKLGLVVTDEQHRFGVSQRAALANKGDHPHLLVMSATPIPRTLALILYGDLDISVIRELPGGRKPIETFAIPSKKRGRALGFLKKQLEAGHQAYIVCPLIAEGESDLASAEAYCKALQNTPLSAYHMAILHGRLKAREKELLMESFKQNQIQILIATTVVEVGVDVPNATIMMIENAERFGLSQLHQLRGRVGRGGFQSYCILVSDHEGEENIKRLQVMTSTLDGFQIAEEDLKLRGPGDFFGFRQHGLPLLKIANLLEDTQIVKETQELAKEVIKTDPELSTLENRFLRRKVKRLFEQNGEFGAN